MEEYQELSKNYLLTLYRYGLDWMVGLYYVSDQKHLTAVNSMTVVSMIYFCDIIKVVKHFDRLMIYFNIKKVFIENFMDKIMSKILKKLVCENGDCSINDFKIGPLISLLAVNLIIAASLAVFIDKMI